MTDKQALRAQLRAGRARRTATERAAAAAALAAHALAMTEPGMTIAAYAAVGDEPPTRTMLEQLSAGGRRVLLPVVQSHDLLWADFTGWADLRETAVGLLEPAGSAADAPQLALAFVPALAVDGAGHRLGQGGGFYDRWLARAGVRAVAIVYDDELLPVVPHEPHDRPVQAVLTPTGCAPGDASVVGG